MGISYCRVAPVDRLGSNHHACDMRAIRSFLSVCIMAAATGAAPATQPLSDGLPDPLAERLSPRQIMDLRMMRWMREQMAAGAMPGMSTPDANFYILYIDFAHPEHRVEVAFVSAGLLTAMIAPGGQVCNWVIDDVTYDKKDRLDGYATLKSNDGKITTQLWAHLPVLRFGETPWEMPYDKWQHHEHQVDAVIYRSLHLIQVINKPDGAPDDQVPDGPPKVPAAIMFDPGPPPPEPATRVAARGRCQAQLGRRLPAAAALPDIDFYLADASVEKKKATFRFPDLPGMYVVVTTGDKVCGWEVSGFRSDAANPGKVAILMTPYGSGPTVDVWKRVDPAK